MRPVLLKLKQHREGLESLREETRGTHRSWAHAEPRRECQRGALPGGPPWGLGLGARLRKAAARRGGSPEPGPWTTRYLNFLEACNL